MKRILLALVLLMFVLTGVTALDQSLYLSMEVDSYDLRDIKDFSSIKDFESLETTLWPLAAYTYGNTDSTGIKGFAQLGLPYTVGDSLDTLFPYVYSETYYRFRLPEATSLMRTGLITQLGKDQTYDMTYLNVFGLFTFYPIDKMQEVKTAYRYRNYDDGIRLGFGVEAGASMYNVLEDADLIASIAAAPAAYMNAGTELFENVWVQANLSVSLPSVNYAATGDKSFDYNIIQQGNFHISFIQDTFQIRAGVDQNITVFDLYTDNGLFKDADYTYSINPWISLSFSIIDNLNVYVKPILYTTDGNIGPLLASVSVDYFLF